MADNLGQEEAIIHSNICALTAHLARDALAETHVSDNEKNPHVGSGFFGKNTAVKGIEPQQAWSRYQLKTPKTWLTI